MLRRPPRIALLACALAAALALAACGRDDGVEESAIIGETLTVYSSLPLSGPLAPVARDVVRAEKLALQEAGGRAGAYDVSYVSVNSADPDSGHWEPGRVAANARKAVQTPNTIAYLGEFEAGASSVSLPILNEGGIVQVSPYDTFAELTDERFYPSGRRTFTRVVPDDDRQAAAMVAQLRRQGARRVVVADDRGPAGVALAELVEQRARDAGIDVLDRMPLEPEREVPPALGRAVRAADADAFVYTGGYRDFAVDVLRAVHAADDGQRLVGGATLAAPELPERAGAAARRLTVIAVDPAADAQSRAFERRFADVYGTRPHPQAVLGHRAMRVVLDAIRRAGASASSRREVAARALAGAGRPRARFSAYRIDRLRLVRVRPGL